MNSVTAFVDGSAIYGSSEERMRVLRENNGTGSVVAVSSVSRLLLLLFSPIALLDETVYKFPV